MPTFLRPDNKPIVQFDPLIEISPFALFRRLKEGHPLVLVDVRAVRESLTLEGAIDYPGDSFEPPDDADTILFDLNGTEAEPIVRELQAAGYERLRMLFGGLELYQFALDPEVVGKQTFLTTLDSD